MNNTNISPSVHSPCYARNPIKGETSIKELPLRAKINLRGNHKDPEFNNKISHTFNIALPTQVNTKQVAANDVIYCLGPNEWMIYTDIEKVNDTIIQLKKDLSDVHHSLVDVSDYYTHIQLSGPQAERILRTATPFDVHPSVFKVNDITQTRFGHASIILDRVEQQTFTIQIRWSYTEYLWDYLVSALEIKSL